MQKKEKENTQKKKVNLFTDSDDSDTDFAPGKDKNDQNLKNVIAKEQTRPNLARPQYAMWYEVKDKKDSANVLPMKSVSITGTLEGFMSDMHIDLSYCNTSKVDSIECSYEFPLDSDTVFAGLTAIIGDKEVEAIIKDKETAKERYDDAVGQGHVAVFAERKKAGPETMVVQLGNLLPL